MSTNPYQAQIDELELKIQENQALLEDSELAPLAQQEISKLEQEKKVLEDAANQLESALNDEGDPSQPPVNAIIEIRGGAGGDEAKIWAEELMRMYVRFAETKNLKVEFIDDLVFKVKGKTDNQTAYQLLKYESGVHRVQRVPVTESQGRIHTSTASVAVLPEVHPHAVEIKDEDLDWQFMRASGAGGQSVNKTSSAVRLTHKPSGIVVVSKQERKQTQNRQIALELLRAQLWEIEEEKKQAKLGQARSAIGRNQRAEKIRTYNFPQNRVTDHRIHESWYNLPEILEGGISEMLSTVATRLNEESAEENTENS